MRTLVALAAVAAASAFAPGAMTGLRLKSAAAVSRRPATSPKMSLDAIEGAQQLLAVAQNVPFVDEVTGEAQGFTAPLNHFASVSALEIIPGVAGAACRLSLSTAYPLPACNPRHTPHACVRRRSQSGRPGAVWADGDDRRRCRGRPHQTQLQSAPPASPCPGDLQAWLVELGCARRAREKQFCAAQRASAAAITATEKGRIVDEPQTWNRNGLWVG